MQEKTEIIRGFHAVREALESGVSLNAVYIDKSRTDKRANLIRKLSSERGVKLLEVPKEKLKELAPDHQGFVAVISPVQYLELEEFLKRKLLGVIVAVDGIQDPQNLGAIYRVCECVGVDGVVLPERGCCQITSTVIKVSSGAALVVPTVRVKNLARALDKLKEAGFWVASLTPEGETTIYQLPVEFPLVVVFGNEETGIRRLIKEKSDFLVSIPQKGKIQSLNVSTAAAVTLYEIARRKGLFD